MSTNNLFRLTFPDGWKETTVYTYEGPFDGGMQHNLVLSISPGIHKETAVERFARDLLAASAQSMPGFEMMEEGEQKLPTGESMFVAIYKYSPSDEISYYQKQYYVIRDFKGYIFTSTFSRKTLETFAWQVDHIVMSLMTTFGRDKDL
jgi:hypothetical protein